MARTINEAGRRSISVSSTAILLLLQALTMLNAVVAKAPEEAQDRAQARCSVVDSRALQQFQSEITFGGSELAESWRDGTDCCRGWAGVRCNFEGRVEALTISSSRAISTTTYRPPPSISGYGLIGESLSNLTDLEELTIVNIGFHSSGGGGSIPPAWGRSLGRLKVLRLEGCGVGGRIPVELCELTRLESLVLKGNRLDGDVPKCFFFSTSSSDHAGDAVGRMMIKNLTLLDFAGNRLTGLVPSIPCLPYATCKSIMDRHSN